MRVFNMPTVVFRVDANVKLGIGHLMRCLTLADKLNSNNIECIFILSFSSTDFIYKIKERGHGVKILENESDINRHDFDQCATLNFLKSLETKPVWLVVDHYNIDIAWELSVRPYVLYVLVIDDLADRPHYCDAVVNSNLNIEIDSYKDLIPVECVKFFGPKYSLLSNQYRQYRDLKGTISPDINSIAIFMGGGDHLNITEHMIDNFFYYFDYLKDKKIALHVVISGQHPNKLSIENKCKELSFITLHIDTSKMAQILSNVDLCIGAGGGAALERCCIGVPSIVVTFADNQIHGIDALTKNGAIIFGGDYRKPGWKQLFKNAALQIQDFKIRKAIASKSRQFVDGNGCDRVAAYMEFCIFDPVFKPINIEDAEILLEWRNQENVRFFSGSTDLIIYGSHIKWLEASLSDSHQILLMLWVGTKRFGHIRYKIKQNIATVSIMVNPLCQNLGIGYLMLENTIPILLSIHQNILHIQAKIHRDNVASLAVFKKAGYVLIDNNDIWVTKQKSLVGQSK